MAKTRDQLTPKQIKAIALLAYGQTHQRVAQEVGVTEATVRGWISRNPFKKELTRTMERVREAFEARMFALGHNATAIVNEMMTSNDQEQKVEGAKISINAAVRLASRYKELQVEGFAPAVPLIVFPSGTTPPWAGTPPTLPPPTEGTTIDVEAGIVEPERLLQSGDGDGDK